jgi:glycosyltransferase involved in cell wall biosynthesis
MRISIIGPAYPLRGGIAHHVYWVKKALVSRGHEIQVISFRKLYPNLFFPGTTEFDTSRLKFEVGALPILSPLNPVSWRRAMNSLKAFLPELVLIQWWQPFFGLVVGSLARWCNKNDVKCIIECHNIFPHEPTPLDRPLLKFALSPADSLITHSNSDREDLLNLVPGKQVSVTSLPVPVELAGSKLSRRGGRTILFFGKVRKYKGLEVLLEAMPLVLAKIDCKLIIAGEFYDSIEKYSRRISALKIEEHVQIDNRYIPNEEVPNVFARADVLVLPYVSASQSGVARIALLNGMPIIASTAGGLSESIKNDVNGLLFTCGDSAALADRIVTYFVKNLGPTFSQNILEASELSSNYQIAELIESMIGAKPTTGWYEL